MMRNLTRYAAGAIAGIILTAGTGIVISAIAAKTEVKDVAVRQVIDLTAEANGEATLTDLQIHPLKGLELVIKLPEGASVANSIQVIANYDASHSDAPEDGGKVDNAIGKVIDVFDKTGGAAKHRSINLTADEANDGEVHYLIKVSQNFKDNAPSGLAYVDLLIELSA